MEAELLGEVTAVPDLGLPALTGLTEVLSATVLVGDPGPLVVRRPPGLLGLLLSPRGGLGLVL